MHGVICPSFMSQTWESLSEQGGHYTKTAMSSWWGVDSLPPTLHFITASTMEAKEASGRRFVLSPFSQRFFMVVLSGLFSFRKGPCCHLQGADLEDRCTCLESQEEAPTKTPCTASWECLEGRYGPVPPQRGCDVSHLPILVERAQQLVGDVENSPPVEGGQARLPPLLRSGVQEVKNVPGGEVGVLQTVVHKVSHRWVPQGVLKVRREFRKECTDTDIVGMVPVWVQHSRQEISSLQWNGTFAVSVYAENLCWFYPDHVDLDTVVEESPQLRCQLLPGLGRVLQPL